TSQFNTNDVPDIFQLAATSGILPYFTFARTGYIIHSRPMAIGSDTVSSLTESSAGPSCGNALPRAIPSAIAAKIHTGKKRSRVDSLLNTPSFFCTLAPDV